MTTRLRQQVRILVDATIAIGPGKAQLLEAIGRHGSISAAAREMGMSYTRAWSLVADMNRCFTTVLVHTATGGKRGGGATITPAGETVLAHYRAMEAAAAAATADAFEALRPLLPDTLDT